MTTGEKIRHYRKMNGFTLKALGSLVNCEENTIHNFETGKRTVSPSLLKEMARVFQVSEETLWDDPPSYEKVPGLHIIGDRFCEEIDSPVPVEVKAWWSSFEGVKREEGYPAIFKGTYGYTMDLEYWHTGMEEDPSGGWVEEHPSHTEEEVLLMLKKAANLLQNLENVDVFVGERTAPYEAHELIVFFPLGTSNDKHAHVTESCAYCLKRAQRTFV